MGDSCDLAVTQITVLFTLYRTDGFRKGSAATRQECVHASLHLYLDAGVACDGTGWDGACSETIHRVWFVGFHRRAAPTHPTVRSVQHTHPF